MPSSSPSLVVVIADDEPKLIELLTAVLEPVAGRVIATRDGLSAWEAIQQHRPSLAILDASMPGLSGLDVVRRVRAAPELTHVKLVVITGHADGGAAAAQAGADRSLTKPFRAAELWDVVRELTAPPNP